MRRKRIFLTAFILTACLFGFGRLYAQTAQTALKLVLTDGTVTSFLLADQPVLSFDDDQLLITSSTVSAKYALADVSEYHFEDVPDAIEQVEEREVRFVRLSNDEVVLYGAAPSQVAVYDLAGRRLPTVVHQQGEGLQVSLRQLPAATYVISLNHQSIKVIKR